LFFCHAFWAPVWRDQVQRNFAATSPLSFWPLPKNSSKSTSRIAELDIETDLTIWNQIIEPERMESLVGGLLAVFRPTGHGSLSSNVAPLLWRHLIDSRFAALSSQRYGVRIFFFFHRHQQQTLALVLQKIN
jgi:hypothetical protein